MTPNESHIPSPGNEKGSPSLSGEEQEFVWTEITAALNTTGSEGGVSTSRARLWTLVLEARGIPCRREPGPHGWRILVPPRAKNRALEEIRVYHRENRGWPPLPLEGPETGNPWPSLLLLALLALFFNITRLNLSEFGWDHIPWTASGSAHAGKILAGEWWRTITALTLHADGVHLFGNMVIGGFFVIRLCREVGSGPGWFLVLFSGAAGNFLNALVQSPDHRAVGASTALFGAVGILASLGFLKSRGLMCKRQFLPLAGGAALLGLLGSGGDNTDLGAHLFGFLAGLALGAAAGKWIGTHGMPREKTKRILGLGTAVAVIAAWAAALRFESILF